MRRNFRFSSAASIPAYSVHSVLSGQSQKFKSTFQISGGGHMRRNWTPLEHWKKVVQS